ncbi:MAG: hypothetical protein K2X94_04600 [Amoebophilaceae bacterium]|nr:hypothetical protein [Amoebophilaceae bacterium]
MNSNIKYSWSRILFLVFLVFCGCDYSKGKGTPIGVSKRNTHGFSSIPSYTPEAVKNLDVVSMQNVIDEDPGDGGGGGDGGSVNPLTPAVDTPRGSVNPLTPAVDTPIDSSFLDRMQSFQQAEVSSILDQACLTEEAALNQ